MRLETIIDNSDENENREEIRKFIAEKFRINVEKITDDAALKTLNVDSLDVFDTMMELEGKYNVIFPSDYEPKKYRGDYRLRFKL